MSFYCTMLLCHNILFLHIKNNFLAKPVYNIREGRVIIIIRQSLVTLKVAANVVFMLINFHWYKILINCKTNIHIHVLIYNSCTTKENKFFIQTFHSFIHSFTTTARTFFISAALILQLKFKFVHYNLASLI